MGFLKIVPGWHYVPWSEKQFQKNWHQPVAKKLVEVQPPSLLHMSQGNVIVSIFFFFVFVFILFLLDGGERNSKECGPYVVTVLNWTPRCYWYMVRLVLKNGHQNNTYFNEIGLCAHILTILSWKINTTQRVYVTN